MEKKGLFINSLFVVGGFLIAFVIGYFIFGQTDSASEDSTTETTETEEVDEEVDEEADVEADEEPDLEEVPEDAYALSRNGCLGCHSVESIDAPGGDIGPDLSRAYPEMEGKHGKNLDEFLQDPTAAVMATIIAENPLEDDEREEIVKVLKDASEKLNSKDSKTEESESNEEDSEDSTSEDDE